jgi:hypothetical protein
MHKELEMTHLKAARYQAEVSNSNLKDQLEHCETDIRGELAEETAEQMQYTREYHEVIVKRLKQQAQNEEETERMRDEYQHEIRELSKPHVAE